jgi:hypothetical protein
MTEDNVPIEKSKIVNIAMILNFMAPRKRLFVLLFKTIHEIVGTKIIKIYRI